MDSFVIPQEPGYPKGLAGFFSALKDGIVRTLANYYLLLDEGGRRNLELEAGQCQEFAEFQSILFEAHEVTKDAPKEIFLAELYTRLYRIWPPSPPEIVGTLRNLICTSYQRDEDEIFILKIVDLPEDVQITLNELRERDEAGYKDYLSICHAFESGLEASGFSKGLPEKKARNQGVGKFKGAFNQAIGLRWPTKPKPKGGKVQKPKERTEGALRELERRFYYEAVIHLLLGEFTALDPVIGDEACEARPPILIDCWQILMDQEEDRLNYMIRCAIEYRLRHRGDPEATQIRLESDFVEDYGWSVQFVEMCMNFSSKLNIDYLILCKANTAASELASDEWGMASFDRSKGLYSDQERAHRRSSLSALSVNSICTMAGTVLKNPNCDGPIFGEICHVLENTKVVKIEEIESRGGSSSSSGAQIFKIHSLPIYEMMRTVVAYEYINSRPIILSVFQIECTPNGDTGDKECPATYKLKRVQTSYYKPNFEKNRFVPMEISSLSKRDRERPCLAIQAYQLVSPLNEIPTLDGLFFNSLGQGYEDALFSCDLSLLIQCYAAIHPIFAGDPHVDNGEHIEDPLQFMEGLYDQACTTKTEDWNEEPTRCSKIFNLVKPSRSLRQEYTFMRNLAIACDVGNKQYIKRLLGDTWAYLNKKTLCARALESCGFAIHHMNMNSFNAVLKRDKACMRIPELQRFHEFDSKKSFGSLDPYKN